MADLTKTFNALRAVLAPYAKQFSVTSNTETDYTLEDEGAHYRTLFGSVFVRKRDVSFSFYPLQVFRRELALPAALAAKTTKSHRYSMAFATATQAELVALARVVAAGWKLVAARRAEDPKRSYHQAR